MRKRILYIAMLSVMTVCVFAGSALAADKAYYKFTALSANPTQITAPSYTTAHDIGTVTLTYTADYKAAATAPDSSYSETKKPTFTVAYNPAGMSDSTNKLTVATPGDWASNATSKTVALTGKVKMSGTVTITATQGTNTKTTTIKVTIPKKPDPTFDAGNTYEGTAVSGISDMTETTVNISNYPETIELSPSAAVLSSTYNITATPTVATATTSTGKIVFKGGKAATTLAPKGVKVTMTAYNLKADGTKGSKVNKTFMIYISKKPDPVFTTTGDENYQGEAVLGITDMAEKTISITNFPNAIDLSPTAADLKSTYGITATVAPVAATVTAPETAGTVKFKVAKADAVGKKLAPDGVKITMTAYSVNADTAKTPGNKVSKTFTISLKPKDDPVFGSFAEEATAQAGTDNTVTIDLTTYPNAIELSPTVDELKNTYGITATPTVVALDKDAAATNKGSVKFVFGKDVKKLLPDGLPVKMTAYSINRDGAATKGNKVTKTFTMKVTGFEPTVFKGITAATPYDISTKATNKNGTIIKGGMTLGTAAVFELENVTNPVTFKAEGLPKGITLVQDTGGTEFKAKAGAKAHLEGTPEEAGYYDKIKVTATNDVGTLTQDCVMDIVFPTVIDTTATLPELTWGQPYNGQVKFVGGSEKHPVAFTIKDAATTAPAGLDFNDAKPGLITGTFNLQDKSNNVAAFKFGTDASKTGNITITAKSDVDTAAVTAAMPLTVKAVKPSVVDTVASIQNTLDRKGMKIGTDEITFDDLFRVTGPGTIEIDTEKTSIPDGFTLTPKEGATEYGFKLSGKPKVTAKNTAGKITLKNGAGSVAIPLKFTIGVDDDNVKITPTAGAIPAKKLGDAKTPGDPVLASEATFKFEPGPVKWKAKNLPAGVTLSIDKSVSNDQQVVLVGTPKSQMKADKNGRTIYEITATNTVTGHTRTVSQDWKLFPKPKIAAKNLPALTIGKPYTASITGTGANSRDMTWTVTLSDAPAETAALPAVKGAVTGTANYAPGTSPTGKATLSVGTDAKTGMPTIVGSLDRVPATGRVKVAVTLATGTGTTAAQETSADFYIDIKSTTAKVTTSKLNNFTTSETSSQNIVATGTLPIEMKAYIDVKPAKDFFGITDGSSLDLSTAVAGLSFTYDNAAKDGTGKLTYTAGGGYTLKNLPIKIRVGNLNPVKKKVGKVTQTTAEMVYSEKTLNVNITGTAPFFTEAGNAVSPDVTVFGTAGTAIDDIVYTVAGDKPYAISVSPNKLTNGLTPAIDEDAGTVTISGTPTENKETKSSFTITVKNTSTNAKSQAKIVVIGQLPAGMSAADQKKVAKDAEGYVARKEIEIGKSLSLKVSATGSKRPYQKNDTSKAFQSKLSTKDVAYRPITWKIADASSEAMETLVALGLSFDTATGIFKGIAQSTTSGEAGVYEPVTVTVNPVNDAEGSAVDFKVLIGIKGKKPKLMTKAITLIRGNSGASVDLASDTQRLSTNLSGDEVSYVNWEWDNTAYSTWGFKEDITHKDDNSGQIDAEGDLPTATKGVNLKVKAANIGQLVTGNVKFVIKDPKPVITAEPTTITSTALDNSPVIETVTFTVADDCMTGDTKMLWKIAKQPSDARIKAKLVQAKDTKSCEVTLTIPKNLSSPDVKDATLTVSATNQSTKEIGLSTITINVKAVVPADKTALPEEKSALPEDEPLTEEEELKQGEGTVTYGDARNESALTQNERRMLAECGYIIAAILPEITVDDSGQYDLETVSLDEAAPVDGELVWFAFPRNAEDSEDDTIVEFYDEAGAEIFAVPESRKVVPAPWLDKDVTYAPVIAVKAPVAGDAKDSLDEAEEGDTVTEKALEEAAAQ